MTIDDKFKEPLTHLVKEEIDNWEVSVKVGNTAVGYEPMIKPFLQGMGVVVTQNAIDMYKTHIIHKSKNYFGMDLREAVNEFTKDYIIHKYIENDFSVKNTANAIGLDKNNTNPDSARVVLSTTAKNIGLSLADVRKNPQNYIAKGEIEFTINDQKVTDVIENQIREYVKIVNPVLMKGLITTYSKNISERFANLAKNIVQNNYFVEQI